MKPTRIYIFILLLLLAVCPVGNNHVYAWVEGKELAVVPASKETIEILNESGVDIEQIYEGKILIWATQAELDMLTQLGIPYTILYDEMQAERNFFNQWKTRRDYILRSPGTKLDYELDYHSYSDMVTALRNLEANYPSICKMVDVGDTVNGREIWAVVISDNVNIEENEPEVKLEGGIHGDEWSATEVPIDIAKYLCQNYSPGSGNDATVIVENLETWIIPMRNPDGHESNSRYNARGVDLNRNFDGPTGCSQGKPSCFSEPETQSARNMFEIMGKRFSLGISYHSGVQCFNSVWNYDCIKPPDEEIFWHNRTTCSNNSGYFNEIPAPHGLADAYDTSDLPDNWGWTNGAEWYVTRGDVTDYTYLDWGMLDTTIECTKTKTPATSEIQSFLAWHRQPTLNYLKKAMQGIHGLVTNAETGQPLDAKIEIQGKSMPILTDPDVGDYHRILMPGTYTVIASANGYVTKTLPGITVTADSGTTLNIQLRDTGSPPPIDNLLLNGSFEYDADGDNNPDDWIIKEPVELDGTESVDGQYSARIESTVVINNINRQYVDLKPHTTYTLSAWVKTENVTSEGAQVYPYDYGGVIDPSQWIRVVGTTDWSHYSMQFTTGADPSKARINFRLKHATGRAWFDDIRLIEYDAGLPPPMDNLLLNGSFEYDADGDNNPDDWIIKEPVALDGTESVDGQYSARIESTVVINNINRQYVDLKPHTTYTLSAWLKTENVTSEGAQVYPYDYGGVIDPSQWIRVVGTTDWSHYSMQFTTGADPSKARINFRLKHATGRAWFDDIKLF